MQRLAISLLLVATTAALGQANPRSFHYDSQAGAENPRVFLLDPQQLESSPAGEGCEVAIVSASFDRPAQLVLTASRHAAAPSLRLELENKSDKIVRSIDLVAHLKVKDSRYQLDSVTRDLPLHVTRADGWQRLQLAESTVGFAGVSIEQVNFADGSLWKPASARACAYSVNGATERIAK